MRGVSWKTRQERLETSWERFREKLFSNVITQEALSLPLNCSKCACELQYCVRCMDCGPGILLCSTCDMDTHDNHPFHDRESWNGEFFRPLLPTEAIDSQGEVFAVSRCVPCKAVPSCCPCCKSDSMKVMPSDSSCILINLKGRFDLHIPQLMCGSCNTASEVSLVHLGYWPGSPTNASYFFDHKAFHFWDTMQKNMPGSSSNAFVKTLAQISEKKGRAGIITPSTFSKAFQEWRYCQFEICQASGMDFMSCPCCHKGQLACHMDGNRKTYRWKKVNAGTIDVYYGETFFCDDNKVKKSLEQTYKYKTSKTTGQDSCGQVHWQAAKSQAKSLQKLDETGVMVAGCRHALMQKAVNMWTGEMYGYGFYLQKNVLSPIGVKFLFYDVICKYWPWMKRVSSTTTQSAEKTALVPALGQMHGKLHKWTCRVLYGSQWQEGAGHTTGEEMETAFQYLSRCGSTTKNMTRAGRIEYLTEHVLFWNQKKILSLPKYLSMRYMKVICEINIQNDELVKTGVSESVLRQWKSEIISAAKDEEASTARVSDNERAEYFRLLQETREAEALQQFNAVSSQSLSVLVGNVNFFIQAKQLQEDLETKKARLVTLKSKLMLQGVEEEMLEDAGIQSLADSVAHNLRDKIMCMMSLIRRRQEMISKETAYAKQRSKLRKKNDAEKKTLKDAISNYNKIVVHCSTSSGYTSVAEDHVLAGRILWESREGPVRDKMEAVEIYNKYQRYQEEKKQIASEMRSFLEFYKRKADDLKNDADVIQSTQCSGEDGPDICETVTSTRYSTNVLDRCILAGKRALKLKGVHFCKTQLFQGLHYFKLALAKDPALYEELKEYEEEESSDEMDDDEDRMELVVDNDQEPVTNLMVEEIQSEAEGQWQTLL